MGSVASAAFDKLAFQYDAVWSETAIGKAQRSAVWKRIDPLFRDGDLVLDLGCGTGVDALHLKARGVLVHGIDSSVRMVEIARRRGVQADCCPIERLVHYDLRFDGAISNFGALNCISAVTPIARTLATMVRSGGHVALCIMNRICLWEIVFYLLHGQVTKAFRRLKRETTSSIGARVSYPPAASVVSAFKRDFRLVRCYGIGLFVPPSYVPFFTGWEVEQLASLDQKLSDKPLLRSIADHRLYIFKRI